MMDILNIDGLPPRTGKGTLLRLLIEEGKIKKSGIGKIILNGGMATIEVSDGWAPRLARALDGIQVESRHIRAWQQGQGTGQDHFDQLLAWLAMEAGAEQQQRARSLQAKGRMLTDYALGRLVIRATDVGLGGRFLVQLAPRNEQLRLPWTRLSVGAPIILSEEVRPESKGEAASWRGVISRKRSHILELSLNQTPELDGSSGTYRVDQASDDIARQRMSRALAQVASAKADRPAELRAVLLGQRPAEFSGKPFPGQLEGFLAHLNPSQQEAVRHGLSAEDVAIIHGPPGTGKTTTVVALIVAAVANGARVLANAPSNLAVDNMVERLVAAGVGLVRLGHPARVLPGLQEYTLDALVEQHQDYKRAKKLRKEAFGLRERAGKYRRARPAPGEKQALRREAKEMLAEARHLEASTVERVLDKAPVILSTLTAIDSATLGQRRFDLCVIDEAGQSTEPATWIPIARADRLLLAGDHQQLPPTVISRQAQKEGFGISLLELMMRRDGGRIARRLDVQYRMHEQIMGFSSAEFYHDTLLADSSVRGHLLCDLPGVATTDLTNKAVTFIDTAGASYDEETSDKHDSRGNPQEAALVARKVEQLLAAGLGPDAIAVITPYSAQVQLLRELLPGDIEIDSVDGFQGREKEAVIISLVRSNREGQVGFLAENRRMNVALTRARRYLLVIGDSATITSHPFYQRLVDYFDSIGAYHSVWEEEYS